MAAMELAENVMKYGGARDETDLGVIIISAEGELLVQTENRSSRESADVVIERVEHLKHRSAHDLYREKLKDMFQATERVRGGLGLYRIAYEGKFTLEASYVDDHLKVSARRKK